MEAVCRRFHESFADPKSCESKTINALTTWLYPCPTEEILIAGHSFSTSKLRCRVCSTDTVGSGRCGFKVGFQKICFGWVGSREVWSLLGCLQARFQRVKSGICFGVGFRSFRFIWYSVKFGYRMVRESSGVPSSLGFRQPNCNGRFLALGPGKAKSFCFAWLRLDYAWLQGVFSLRAATISAFSVRMTGEGRNSRVAGEPARAFP